MICNHCVFVAAPGYIWEAAAIIIIQFTDWFIPNMKLGSVDGKWNIFHLRFFWCILEYYFFNAYSWKFLLRGLSQPMRGLDNVGLRRLN